MVYTNAYWAGPDNVPGIDPVWTAVATCVGTAPMSQLTDEQQIAQLNPNIKGLQVVLDPWTPALPTTAEMLATEAAVAAADPKISVLRQAARVLPFGQVELIEPLRVGNPENVKRVESILSAESFDQLLPVRSLSYTYVNLLRGIGAFPDYCKTYEDGRDSDLICRKFLATSFAHNVQEVGGNSPSLTYRSADHPATHQNPGADKFWKSGDLVPMWNQALWYNREVGYTEDSTSSAYGSCDLGSNHPWSLLFPCADQKAYYGRGSKQLSYNYNYGLFSQALYGDANYLLENPAPVADSWLNFASGVWFAITPQSPKPPMTWVIDGTWIPNAADKAAGLSPGFGATVVVINGGIECGAPNVPQVEKRVYAYKNFAAYFNVPIDADEMLDCANAKAFPPGSAASTQTYWAADIENRKCGLASYQTPFQAQVEGDYERCINYSFRAHFWKDGKKISDYGN